ncbi:hypothetical protein [Streptomyces fuscichromogenes]|uniref:hypothetical protein n=1 Tax=Streptomyces fuscichromogenes TaxID=1324013 RepID=UPI001E4B3E93|nr:hypothetical protein [Streptomyces fuscichromogenes]
MSIWAACLAGLALADGIHWVQHHRLPGASGLRIAVAGTAFVAIVNTASATRRRNRRIGTENDTTADRLPARDTTGHGHGGPANSG